MLRVRTAVRRIVNIHQRFDQSAAVQNNRPTGDAVSEKRIFLLGVATGYSQAVQGHARDPISVVVPNEVPRGALTELANQLPESSQIDGSTSRSDSSMPPLPWPKTVGNRLDRPGAEKA